MFKPENVSMPPPLFEPQTNALRYRPHVTFEMTVMVTQELVATMGSEVAEAWVREEFRRRLVNELFGGMRDPLRVIEQYVMSAAGSSLFVPPDMREALRRLWALPDGGEPGCEYPLSRGEREAFAAEVLDPDIETGGMTEGELAPLVATALRRRALAEVEAKRGL